jgi:thioesterase domain-containing protein
MRFSDEMTELAGLLRELAGDAQLELDMERLRSSSAEENARYLAGVLKDRGLLEVNAQHLAATMDVSRANLLSYRSYEPATLPRGTNVSLYRAMQGDDFAGMPPDHGWNPLLQDPIRVHDVDATHYSILERVRMQGSAEETQVIAAT